MFGLFKEIRPIGTDDLDGVRALLNEWGFDLSPYGAEVAVASLQSGYGRVEVASHIALTMIAFDVRESGEDLLNLSIFRPHAIELIKELKIYKDQGLMRHEICKNDSTALYRVTEIDPQQLEWVNRVLSDPIAGKERLATNRVYEAHRT